MKYTYRNKTQSSRSLVGYGTIEAGKTIDSNEEIHNAFFELVEDIKKEDNTLEKKEIDK